MRAVSSSFNRIGGLLGQPWRHRLAGVPLADRWIYALAFGPASVLLLAIGLQPYVPAEQLLKDPLIVAKEAGECCRFYYGLISNLGVLIWFSSAAVCAFAAALLFSLGLRTRETAFLAAAAAFTAWLALDDVYMIHEDVLPWFGVGERLVYAFYAMAAAAYLLLSWRSILACRPLLLGAALGLLGTSVLIDVALHSESSLRVLVEDGAKFLGICAWASYHAAASFECVAGALAPPRVLVVRRGSE